MEAWTLRKPPPDEGRLVGPIVVHDDVDIEVGRHLGFDRVQELAELDGAMAAVQLADHPAGFQVQCGEQRGRTVPLIIVGPSLRLARTKGRSEEHTSELQSQSNLVCRL